MEEDEASEVRKLIIEVLEPASVSIEASWCGFKSISIFANLPLLTDTTHSPLQQTTFPRESPKL